MRSNSKRRTFYDILELDPRTADHKAIRQAYLKLSLKNHPDKNPNDSEAAKARFIEIGEAYETLKDARQRAQYDRALRNSSLFGGDGHAAYQEQAGSSSDNNDNEDYSDSYGRRRDTGESYESYRDAFDATVAGMSQEEFTAAVGVASVVGSLVGAIVGNRLSQKVSGGGNGAVGGLLSSVGSLAGSMVASRMAGDAMMELHQQSVQRVAYKEECRRCIDRGQPLPEPPPKSKWTQMLEETMTAVKEQFFVGSTANTADHPYNSNNSNSYNNNSQDYSRSRQQQQQQYQNQYSQQQQPQYQHQYNQQQQQQNQYNQSSSNTTPTWQDPTAEALWNMAKNEFFKNSNNNGRTSNNNSNPYRHSANY